jgi:hypothetical protein
MAWVLFMLGLLAQPDGPVAEPQSGGTPIHLPSEA